LFITYYLLLFLSEEEEPEDDFNVEELEADLEDELLP
jgi:hypothetical protein